MSISLYNHEQRITALENKGSGSSGRIKTDYIFLSNLPNYNSTDGQVTTIISGSPTKKNYRDYDLVVMTTTYLSWDISDTVIIPTSAGSNKLKSVITADAWNTIHNNYDGHVKLYVELTPSDVTVSCYNKIMGASVGLTIYGLKLYYNLRRFINMFSPLINYNLEVLTCQLV